MDRTDVPCNFEQVINRSIPMDAIFLKAQAERCRFLAKNADEFTKRRLFILAVNYEKRLMAAEPSAAAHIVRAPLDTKSAPVQV
jgi:hypothetical protein